MLSLKAVIFICIFMGLMSTVVDFTNILQTAAFAPIFFFQKIAKPNCKKRKSAKTLFIQKPANKMLAICYMYFYKIDFTCSQSHQHFASSFCIDIFAQKNMQRQTAIRENLCKSTLAQKKLLIKC